MTTAAPGTWNSVIALATTSSISFGSNSAARAGSAANSRANANSAARGIGVLRAGIGRWNYLNAARRVSQGTGFVGRVKSSRPDGLAPLSPWGQQDARGRVGG